MSREAFINLKGELDRELRALGGFSMRETELIEASCAVDRFCDGVLELFGVRIKPDVRYDQAAKKVITKVKAIGDIDEVAWQELRKVIQ